MKKDYTEKVLERRIMITFMENHDWAVEGYDLEDYIEEYREDYEEYRDWYMTCCA